jgi:hypothetical protein
MVSKGPGGSGWVIGLIEKPIEDVRRLARGCRDARRDALPTKNGNDLQRNLEQRYSAPG